MGRIFIATAVALVLALPALPGPARAQEQDGRQIVQQVRDRHFLEQSIETVAVALIDAKGGQKNLVFTSWVKRQANGLMQNTILFDSPGQVRGTALVTWLDGQGVSRQWLLLPSQIMSRQIAGDSRLSLFMGTDFTYEDLQPLVLDDFVFKVIGSETVDGRDCHLVEVTPATEEVRRAGGYSRRVLAVAKDIEFIVRIEFFDPKGRLEKTQISHDLVNVAGQAWAANAILMQTERPEHKTLMVVRSRDIATEIPDAVFTEAYVREQQKKQ